MEAKIKLKVGGASPAVVDDQVETKPEKTEKTK
jgi:hypothetical protein